jgi:polysaccharide pyruvyl transferase WcaK-like protein
VRRKPLRVAAYGYFGMGNIGNEGSLSALISYLRERHPEADVRCFAAGPEEVARDHGIPAVQLMAFRAPADRGGLLLNAAKVAGRLWDIPRTFGLMRDVDVLVVPGTGVLEEKLMPMPWGLPYWLFLAALSCRVKRRKVVLVSVGAEFASHPLTRLLYRWTVRLSDYCSYRDDESLEAVRRMGVDVRDGSVFPDLAFALPAPEGGPMKPGHVVIGVMAYDGSYDDPRRGPAVRRTYVERMAQLVTRLLDEGRTVTLVVGDMHDRDPARDIERSVRAARPDLAPGRLCASEARTLNDIMRTMAPAEVVVASRFHNVICALKLGKPTISLGYAEKNARLLEAFGLGEFAQPVDAFDVGLLADQIAEVPGVQASRAPLMKDTLGRFEAELDEQFGVLSQTTFRRA